MAHFFRIIGRAAGYAARSHAFDRAISVTTRYVVSEIRLADLIAKHALLKRKYENHLRLLGKTVHRLIQNNIKPIGDDHVIKIVSVLDEIKMEIEGVEEELKRKRDMERAKRQKGKGTNGEGRRQKAKG